MHFKHLVALAALVTASAVSAAPNVPHTYVLVDVGGASLSDLDEQANKASIGATFGVQLDRGFALETSYKNFGKRFDAKFDTFSFAAVGSLPMSRSFDLVGKVGMAQTHISEGLDYGLTGSFTHTGYVVGAGFDYRFQRDWSVRTMVEHYPDYAGFANSLTNVSVGLKYRF